MSRGTVWLILAHLCDGGFDPIGLECGLRIYSFNKFPGDINTAGPGPILWEPLHYL